MLSWDAGLLLTAADVPAVKRNVRPSRRRGRFTRPHVMPGKAVERFDVQVGRLLCEKHVLVVACPLQPMASPQVDIRRVHVLRKARLEEARCHACSSPPSSLVHMLRDKEHVQQSNLCQHLLCRPRQTLI